MFTQIEIQCSFHTDWRQALKKSFAFDQCEQGFIIESMLDGHESLLLCSSGEEPSRCVMFSISPSGPPWDSGHRPRDRH